MALNFLRTELVFDGAADFGRVMLHAVILLAEGAALTGVAFVLERMFHAQDRVIDIAEDARRSAEKVLAERTADEAVTSRAVARLIEGITDLAAGDYGSQIRDGEMPADYQNVASALNLLSQRLGAAVSTVAQASRGVQASGSSLISTAQALQGSSDEQVALLDRARGGFSTLGEGIGATIDLAAKADDAMRQNREEVDRGTQLLGQVVEAMALIEQSTGQIRQIVEVMDNIAFQTNLLALNAGVEAARAGETGRGFAVVASEVRALAQRAAESAREIRGLIDQGQGNVALGTQKVGMTTQALESLIASAQRAAGFVSDIARHVRAQGEGLHGLQGDVSSLESQARHNVSLANRISSAGEELQHHSQGLALGMTELGGQAAQPQRRLA